MTPDDALSLFRNRVFDVAKPYLWSDEEIYGYMDDAQKQLCRLTGGISDSTSDVTQAAVSIGDEYVDIDKRILKLRRVTRLSDYAKVDIWNFEDLERPTDVDDYGIRMSLKLDATTGPIKALIMGMERNKARLVAIPEADDTLSFIVYRMPLEDITASSQEFEVEEQHHQYLLYWMMKLAYEKQDAETFNRAKSEEMEAKFRAYCDEVRHERELREHKYRTVAYGGI